MTSFYCASCDRIHDMNEPHDGFILTEKEFEEGRKSSEQKLVEKIANAIRDSFNSNNIDCYPLAQAAIAVMRDEGFTNEYD